MRHMNKDTFADAGREVMQEYLWAPFLDGATLIVLGKKGKFITCRRLTFTETDTGIAAGVIHIPIESSCTLRNLVIAADNGDTITINVITDPIKYTKHCSVLVGTRKMRAGEELVLSNISFSVD